MSSYRRFVAYLYEYHGETKKENRGFVKVEARNGNCIMEVHMQCPNLAPDQNCQIYGFVRKQQDLWGTKLGEGKTTSGRVGFRLATRADSLNGNPVGLDDLNGMVILLEGGGFYGTQWDDEAISPLAFRLPGEGTEADRGQDGVVSEREEPDEGVQGRTSGDRKAGEREPGIGESERRERNDRESAEIEWNDRESTEKEWSDGETAEREWGDGKEKERGESGREMQEKEETDGVGEETLPAEDRETERDLAQGEDGGFADMEGEMESLEEHTENPNDISERSADFVRRKEKSGADLTGNREEMGRVDVREPQRETNTFWPFEDGEIIECRKMTPADFRYFPKRVWPMRNNRFLLHGYQQFGYLLLGKLRGTSQYVLGVPGVYEQQERMMANMFGFPHFKSSRLPEFAGIQRGRGGYWYRLIDTPNFHPGNGF